MVSPSNYTNALKKYSGRVTWSTLIITIKFFDHYGNITIIPAKCVVDVYMKRTLHDKVDETNINKHIKTIKC